MDFTALHFGLILPRIQENNCSVLTCVINLKAIEEGRRMDYWLVSFHSAFSTYIYILRNKMSKLGFLFLLGNNRAVSFHIFLQGETYTRKHEPENSYHA